jgi:glycosyltransferase involved in cell wall biosynthesis
VRILALDQYSDPGGGQRVLLDALAAFRAQGWTAKVMLPGKGPVVAAVEGLGFETAGLDLRSGGRVFARLARFGRELPGVALQIRRAARAFRPDLVYVNGPRLLPAAALAHFPAPVVFHSHSIVPPGAMRLAAGTALKAAGARVIANCRFVAAQWSRFLPGDAARVIYNGVAGPVRAAARRDARPAIGCIGRIAPEKGQLDFLHAARRMHRALPECRFVICGAPLFGSRAASEYEREVRRAADSLPVEFTGWREDVYDVLAQLELLLVPSAPVEATTRVVPEAWAARVPVVAFASGGIAEILVHGENGFLARDAAQMADIAIALLTHGRAEAIAAAGRAYACWQRSFSPERFAAQLPRFLSRTLADFSTTTARRPRPGAALP